MDRFESADAGKCDTSAEQKGTQTSPHVIGKVQVDIWPEPDCCIAPEERILQNLPHGGAVFFDVNDAVRATYVAGLKLRALRDVGHTRDIALKLLHG